ncbi:MAG TPA: SGNH/GDSL hydrolase family protein, partial [Pyrinomonadaceae bacterium]|nr:SGNH/GDSL hydrolase family protein [Pyrinomonadaceae bacterium]
LVNLSAAGATVTQVLEGQIPRLTGTGPTVVTLGIGANDVLAGVDEEQFAEEYERVVTQMISTGPPVIVLITIPDLDSAPAIRTSGRSDIAPRVSGLNRRIRDIASRHDLLLADLHDAGDKEELSRPELFSSDGFHPSDRGYALWADAIWRTLAPAVDG